MGCILLHVYTDGAPCAAAAQVAAASADVERFRRAGNAYVEYARALPLATQAEHLVLADPADAPDEAWGCAVLRAVAAFATNLAGARISLYVHTVRDRTGCLADLAAAADSAVVSLDMCVRCASYTVPAVPLRAATLEYVAVNACVVASVVESVNDQSFE